MIDMARVYLARLFQTSRLVRGDLAGLLLAMAVFCAILWGVEVLGGDAIRRSWALEKGAVLNGEWYRLFTAQLVHLSRTHTVLNILGLCLVTASIWAIMTARFLIVSTLWSGAAISIGWVLLQSPGPAYVGFSGITHGIYAFGALQLLKRGPVWIGVTVLICLSVKIGHEYFIGAVPGAEAEIGGRVALLSHSLGTFGGALGAFGTSKPVRFGILVLAAIASVHHIA